MVQEIFGVHEHIEDVCRRLAALGTCAVAPSLYDRQGDVAKLQSIDDIRPIVAKVADAQVMTDLDATVKWAVESGAADAGIPVSTIEDMTKALGPGTPSSFHVYPDSPHAFFADYRPSYREAAAKDGWQRLQAWFHQHGLA